MNTLKPEADQWLSGLCMYLLFFQTVGFVFTPTEKEKSDRLMHVRYSATKDQYCRVSSGSEIIQSWDQCVWRKESVFRKVENDWQMVCLWPNKEFLYISCHPKNKHNNTLCFWNFTLKRFFFTCTHFNCSFWNHNHNLTRLMRTSIK